MHDYHHSRRHHHRWHRQDAFTWDLAIEGEPIVGVGGQHSPARREIDATALLVTPGWVDAHTYYDGHGDVGPAAGAIVLAWRHDGDIQQLRGRLRRSITPR